MSSTVRDRISWKTLKRVLSVTDVRQHDPSIHKNPKTSGTSICLKAVLSHPILDLSSLPVVATTFAFLLIVVYNCAERWGVTEEEQVAVSWRQVVIERQAWRLFVAHYFHFSRVQFMINVTSLMALGRYVERKIRTIPMILLILMMGLLGNVFHMILCVYICENPEDHYTTGFSHAIFALKMIQVLSKDAGKRRGPTLMMGVIPVYLGSFAPWEPLFEGVLSDVLVKGKHFASHVSGVLAGLCFPLLDYFWHDHMLVPPLVMLDFTPSSGSQGQLNRCQSKTSSEEQLGRVMNVLREEETRVPLFHELPSNDTVMLFSRREPMKETSLHNQYVSKSDSYLLVKGRQTY